MPQQSKIINKSTVWSMHPGKIKKSKNCATATLILRGSDTFIKTQENDRRHNIKHSTPKQCKGGW